jgi:hypothetical protein
MRSFAIAELLDRHPSCELENPAQGQMQHHLMVPQSLAAFDEAEVPDHTIMAAAHSSQPAIRKTPHVTRMHYATIPSILDESPEAIAGEM